MNPARLLARTLRIATLSAALVVTTLSGASAQLMPEMRSNIEVSGDFVLLGDLFKNAGPAADTPVFRAPAPGTSGTVNARRLAEAALRHGVVWDNPHRIPRVQISRGGTLISEAEIKELLADTLRSQVDGMTVGYAFRIRFTSDQEPLYVSLDKDPSAEVVQLRYSRRSGRFSAVIAAPAGDPTAARITYTGRAVQITSVPVLVRTMRRGTVISDRDVEMREVSVRRTDSATLLDTADVIGMAAKRTLRSGKPLAADDLQQPVLVRKNAEITVSYQAPGLTLTMRARALQSGAMGDVVNIRNLQSNRTIRATVIGTDMVAASTKGIRLLAANN